MVPAWSKMDALHTVCDAQLVDVAAVRGIRRLAEVTPEDVQRWLSRQTDLTSHAIEELVIGAEVSAIEAQLERTDDEDEQSALVFAAEDRAREINEGGPLVQLRHLLHHYSPSLLAAILASSRLEEL